jgi:tetratricopeptide (TPR) repeat protein
MTEQGVIGKILVVVVIVALLIVLWQIPMVQAATTPVYEEVVLVVDPSAERAYEFANRHFDAAHPGLYNIERAERLYEKAYTRNPQLPHLQHQRARVAFLKGDFETALARINDEIARGASPSSYYVRGLIKGYMDDFASSAADYEAYLKSDPRNWAAINDYAWVLIKQGRSKDALIALDWGLIYWPENPWLLNSKATALFEMNRLDRAKEAVDLAAANVANVTEEAWMQAYPGNDPLIAKDGVEAFRKAVEENMHTISLALEASAESVR